MALKRTVHEQCQHCGARIARLMGEWIWEDSHHCEGMPPGPVDPPHQWPIDKVKFVRGNWTADQLMKELDEAFATICNLKVTNARLRLFSKDVTDACKRLESSPDV